MSASGTLVFSYSDVKKTESSAMSQNSQINNDHNNTIIYISI